MPEPASTFELYSNRLLQLRESLVPVIGIHTVKVLMDRAIWETSQRHPELGLLKHEDEGFSFQTLEAHYAGQPEPAIAAAFDDLTQQLLLILARLLGKDMAQRLTQELDRKLPGKPNPKES